MDAVWNFFTGFIYTIIQNVICKIVFIYLKNHHSSSIQQDHIKLIKSDSKHLYIIKNIICSFDIFLNQWSLKMIMHLYLAPNQHASNIFEEYCDGHWKYKFAITWINYIWK